SIEKEIAPDEDNDCGVIEDIEWEEETYHIQPLYTAEDLQEGGEDDGEEEDEEVAVFCQGEHQHTGLVNQSVLQRKADEDGSNWKIAGKDDLNYQAERLDRVEFHGDDAYSVKQGLDDLELDYTAHVSYSTEPRWIMPGAVYPEKEVYHAFHQVPGRPNVYAFGNFIGEGFEGCGLEDSWSDPRLIKRRDVHVQTWEDGSYDYVLQDPLCTPAERKAQLRFTRAKPSHSIRYVSTSREDAKHKLDCLTLQLREFCVERAFRERSIDAGRMVLWQGDPKPRVVFLFKSVTKKVVGAAPYQLSIKNSHNGLGILQTELRLALEETIRTAYSHAYGEMIPWEKAHEFMEAMIPMCCQDTTTTEHRPNTRQGGIAILYGVPIYDPTGWGKHSIDKYGCTEYDTDYNRAYRRPGQSSTKPAKNKTWNSGMAGSEFPDNVLELTSFYVQKALDIMAPIVVISLNKFLTRYLNSGLDSKMLQWARDVRPNRWFRVKLLSARGNTTITTSSKGKKSKTRVIQMIDPVTGVVVDEQRAETFGIRSFHPFYVTQNIKERHPVVKQTMAMAAKRIFQEMDMARLISGQGHGITRFYMNPVKAMNDGTMKSDKRRKKAKFEGIQAPDMARWTSGNLICNDATVDQIKMMMDQSASSHLISVFVLCDCDIREKCKCAFDEESNENYTFYHVHLREADTSCSEPCVFPPRIPVASFLNNVKLWPVQWMHHCVSAEFTGKKKNHFVLPRMKSIPSVKEHDESKLKAIREIETLLKRTKPSDEEERQQYDTETRLSFKSQYLTLVDQTIPSGLFTKRVIVDATRHYGDISGEVSIDVGVYFSSMLEILERVLYTLYMKDYLDSKRVGIFGTTKPGRGARKGFKRVKCGDRYLRPAEQLPSIGQLVGHVIRSHSSSIARLNRKSQLEPCTLSDEEEENEEEEEEMWGVLEWTEILTEMAMAAKKGYESTMERVKVLSH
ncbi:MAG: hypothetical protein ACTSUE_17875, partial [Promethearchaeota archaeon]